ncbi:tail fiber protein [Burkholderia phage vB_BglM_WTB]
MFQPPQITVPWAQQGDQVAIPIPADPNGFVSFTTGYTPDYEISLTSGNPKAKAVERRVQNQLFAIITANLQSLQQYGLPAWYAGTAGGYDKDAQVARQQADGTWKPYRSLVAGNVTDPLNSSSWAYVPQPAELIAEIPMPIGGPALGGTGILSVATDLNTLLNGTFFFASDSIAATSPNSPTQVSGMIESISFLDSSGNRIREQRVLDRNGRAFTRGGSNSTFGAWIESINRRGDTTTGLMSFNGGAAVPNIAQFDSSFSAANTNFVQNALGNRNRRIGFAGSGTLTPSQAGAMVQVSGPGTLTLPSPATMQPGSQFRIYNNAGPGVTVGVTVAAGSNDFIYTGNVKQTTVTLQNGDSIEVSFAGQNGSSPVAYEWDVTGGTYMLLNSQSIVPTLGSTDASARIANAQWVTLNFVKSVSPIFQQQVQVIANTNVFSLITAPAGSAKSLQFSNGAPGSASNSARWQISSNGAAESGGNAGSDFQIFSFDDTGNVLDTVFQITRSTSAAFFSKSLQAASAFFIGNMTAGSVTSQGPLVAQSTASVSGQLSGSTAVFSGNVTSGSTSTTNATITGLAQATNATVTGTLNAASASFTNVPTAANSPVWTQATLSKVSQLPNDAAYVATGSNETSGAKFGNILLAQGSTGSQVANNQGLHAVWNEDNSSGFGSIVNNQGGGTGGIVLRNVNLENTQETGRLFIGPNGVLNLTNSVTGQTAIVNTDGNIGGSAWSGVGGNAIGGFNFLNNQKANHGQQITWGGDRRQYGPISNSVNLEADQNFFVTGVGGATAQATANAIFFLARDAFVS